MDFYILPYGDNIYKIFKEETESKNSLIQDVVYCQKTTTTKILIIQFHYQKYIEMLIS